MSPASLDALEVERYVGACLISQNRSKNSPTPFGYPASFQNCPSERWAGGAPLISFAGYHHHRRRGGGHHLAQLAQGAPLIVTKSFQHRRMQGKPAKNLVQQTKVYENSNNKSKGVDCVSVTSDESFSSSSVSSAGSQSSETCLPRIIKPRKRRKKDRKPPPPHLNRPENYDFSSSIEVDRVPPSSNFILQSPFFDFYHPLTNENVNVSYSDPQLSDNSESPRLHHSFEEVEESEDVNGNQPASTCQCRYCDPEGQIWDVDRNCYSPFLTSPQKFDFNFSPPPLGEHLYDNLRRQMADLNLGENKRPVPFARSASSSSTSSFSSSGDLEVSTEIVTSPNGHRDIEIKFWLSGSVDSKSTNNNKASGSTDK
ncbi:hypothetical protein ABEB36_012539 [Hypothenemus hampei]|uniref:Uncharacterized protein n=1 Tax=Hypothenemus hampei TaxID=57062 RepID=A0ABD1EBU0_HYPHA